MPRRVEFNPTALHRFCYICRAYKEDSTFMTHWAHAHQKKVGNVDIEKIGDPVYVIDPYQKRWENPPSRASPPSTNRQVYQEEPLALDDEPLEQPVQEDEVYVGAGIYAQTSILMG
jgi:hypothetical protein